MRTRNTIVDVYGVLLCGSRFCQSAGSSLPFSAIALMSYASASVTTSASRPSMTVRACLPEPPCDCLMVTFSPVFACQCFGEGGVEVLVQLARRVVGDVEQRDVGGDGGGGDGKRQRRYGEEAMQIHGQLLGIYK